MDEASDDIDVADRDGVDATLLLLLIDVLLVLIFILLLGGTMLHVVLQFPHVNCGCTNCEVYRDDR